MHEEFLEDINCLLNAGEVPDLFASDELEKLLTDMRPVLEFEGVAPSRAECHSVFVHRVRDNLHVVLCMSPVGDALRVRCRQFPSLINCCTIDWFPAWPASALHVRNYCILEFKAANFTTDGYACCAYVNTLKVCDVVLILVSRHFSGSCSLRIHHRAFVT